MIHIAVGTKAQLIKMAPVIRGLKNQHVPYRLIDTGQHAKTTASLRDFFQIEKPDLVFFNSRDDVSSFKEAANWFVSIGNICRYSGETIRKSVFKGEKGICLIHGDTLSTLFSLIIAKRAGVEVGLVEAGLTSGKLTQPFPEEIIRRICQLHSDILFAPNEVAARNLYNGKIKGEIVNTRGNTIGETINWALKQKSHDDAIPPLQSFILVSFHRIENILNPLRIRQIVKIIKEASSRMPVLLVLHRPTKNALKHWYLLKELESNRISILELQPYLSFLRLIRDAAIVITDGGSVQEECYYLGSPCLILRDYTERSEGLGRNAVLVGQNIKRACHYLDQPDLLVKPPLTHSSPSKIIVDSIIS